MLSAIVSIETTITERSQDITIETNHIFCLLIRFTSYAMFTFYLIILLLFDLIRKTLSDRKLTFFLSFFVLSKSNRFRSKPSLSKWISQISSTPVGWFSSSALTTTLFKITTNTGLNALSASRSFKNISMLRPTVLPPYVTRQFISFEVRRTTLVSSLFMGMNVLMLTMTLTFLNRSNTFSKTKSTFWRPM